MKPAAPRPRARKRKRRSQAPNADGQQSEETGSIDVFDPKPIGAGGRHRSRRRQETTPGAGGGGGARGRRRQQGKGIDYISGLPDAILGEIISLLPTKDAGRVQTLAKRWKQQWRSAPLNLNCHELPGFPADDDEALAAAVSDILSRHPGPGRRFCICTRLLFLHCPFTVDAWLQSPALDNLQELCITPDPMDDGPWLLPFPALPAPIFRFAPSLTAATLTECRLPDSTVQTLQFPMLKKLALQHVNISEEALHRMLASCPILEYLLLAHSFGFRHVRISSPSLRSIGVSNQYSCPLITLEEVIIEDAPCLERLLYLEIDTVLRVSVIAAPKLETLGCFNDFNGTTTTFVSSSTVIQGLLRIDTISAVSSVKMLGINMFRLSLDTVIDIMRCFPCLETLYIETFKTRDKNLWRRKHRNFIRTHDIRLKKIVFLNYRGIQSQVSFATFFILNATMLKTMRFEGEPYITDVNFIERQRRLLELEKRASIDAQFHFTVSRCGYYLPHIKDVHDLSITNPFECTC